MYSLLRERLDGNVLLFSFSSVLDKYDFYFMPLINPDGYQFSRTNDRLWRKVLSHVFPNVVWKLFGSIGQEILQMTGVQPTLIKVQQKFPFTNINTIEKFVKQTKLGKHGVDFRTAVTRREGNALEWTLTGTSASSGEAKVGVKYLFW